MARFQEGGEGLASEREQPSLKRPSINKKTMKRGAETPQSARVV